MGELVGLLVIGLICFILFCVYFIFKQIEFILVSVNLYRKMVQRQEAMVKLLLDIRDNTKNYKSDSEDYTLQDPDRLRKGFKSATYEDDSEYTFDRVPGSPPPQKYTAPPKLDRALETGPDCIYCGEELSEKAPQCPKCGKRL